MLLLAPHGAAPHRVFRLEGYARLDLVRPGLLQGGSCPVAYTNPT